VHGLISDGSSFVFMWVPGHVGLVANLGADSAVLQKIAYSCQCLACQCHSDYKALIRLQALRQWQLRWNCESEDKLHSIESRVNVNVPLN